METKKILVTGGAGFVGSHIVDALIEKGHSVRILDNLDKQIHTNGKPNWINGKAEFILGDVTKKEDIRKAMDDIQVVYHEAAAVGVGQSMYELNYYVNANNLGTSNILEEIIGKKDQVEKIVVAASMSSYGEGLYENIQGEKVEIVERTTKQLEQENWEAMDENGEILKPVPTPETKTLNCNSIYALTKKDQEEMFLMIGKTYGIPAVALRYFNVIGSRQSLSNPYTGVAAIFASRLKNNQKPVIYEDGLQTRDFVSVKDIAKANILAMEKNSANYESFNIGTGNPTSIKQVALTLAELLDKKIEPEISKKFRPGDIRHCYADINKAKDKFGYEPSISFKETVNEFIKWAYNEKANDKFDEAAKEMENKGLMK